MQVQKAKALHPDAHLNGRLGDKRAWLAVLSAYQTLRNPKARLVYDASIQRQERNQVVQAGREVSLRRELENELQAALHTAYFGPPLPSGLAPGQFPDCFEADERSTISGTEDILHLLYGRQLLGVVRLRDQPKMLSSDDRLLSSNKKQSLRSSSHDQALQTGLPADQSESRQKRKEEIIDLMLNDYKDNDCEKAMATAVRTWIEDKDKNQIKRRVTIYKNDTVLATVDDEGPQSKRVARIQAGLSPAGFSHTVVRHSAPLIHHLAIITKTNLCVAKARRPWLPPPSFWLFKPRTHTHATGGWIVDWPGHQQENRPGWICPEIIVFIIALDTLDREARLGTDNLKGVENSLGLDKESNGRNTVWQRWIELKDVLKDVAL